MLFGLLYKKVKLMNKLETKRQLKLKTRRMKSSKPIHRQDLPRTSMLRRFCTTPFDSNKI